MDTQGTIDISHEFDGMIFSHIEDHLQQEGFEIVRQDTQRPWGGFFVINEKQAPAFVARYFPGYSVDKLVGHRKVSPKILIVEPEKRLSWQYHHRRSEVWRVVGGRVGVVRSDTDEQGSVKELNTGDVITLQQGERHRLVGLEGYGLVAEIWQHTDPDHPSDEDDIVRVSDDFDRS